MNDAFCSLLGLEREALLRMNLSDLDVHFGVEGVTPPQPAAAWRRFETAVRGANAARRDVEVSAWVLAGGDTVLTFVRDLSAQRRAQE